MNGRTWFSVSSGLLRPEHCRRIGQSLWVFLWMIHHEHKPAGKPDGLVSEGRPVTYEDIANEIGLRARTIRYHVKALEEQGYIRSERDGTHGRGVRYFITNPVRWNLNGDHDRVAIDCRSIVERVATNGKTEWQQNVERVAMDGMCNKEQRTKELQRTKPRGASFNSAEIELPGWLSRETWTEFVEHRRESKKPLTERAAKANIRKLSELRSKGQDPRAVIDQTIAGGWTGLFDVKTSRKAPKAQAPLIDTPDAYELTRRQHLRAKADGVNIQ
jgi:DNA-binding transcriptional ArsR family regulator